MYLCICAGTYVSSCMCGGQRITAHLLPGGSPGLNSGYQGWWEVFSPTEPSFRLSPFPVVTFPDIKDKFQKRIS